MTFLTNNGFIQNNRLRPTLAKPILAILIGRLWPNRLWPTLIGRLWPNLPRREGPRRVRGPNPEKVRPRRVGPRRVGGPKPRKSEAPKGGAPEGWGPEGWDPEGWGAQNFALFFPFPPTFRSHCVSLGVFSWNFGGVLKRCRVRAPAARSGGAAGVSHDSPRAQTCTFDGPGLHKHHQNSTRRPPERHKKSTNGGREGRKRAKFWAVRRRTVQRRTVRRAVQRSPNPQPQQDRTT